MWNKKRERGEREREREREGGKRDGNHEIAEKIFIVLMFGTREKKKKKRLKSRCIAALFVVCLGKPKFLFPSNMF
jgi:hypothetical protein